jgi:hypothetical protein
MTEQTNIELNSVSGQLTVYPEESQSLQAILNEMSDESNLGEDFTKKEYICLVFIGLIIPLILMVWGWLL